MKTRLCMLEFIVSCLTDIRLLYRAWNNLLTLEGRGNTESTLVNVAVDDRLPGEEVALNFHAAPEVLDKFLDILEQNGIKFSCDELIPGMVKMCRIDHSREVW